MATISCLRREFDSMCVELSNKLDSCEADEAGAGLKCLALAIVGFEGSDEERASALSAMIGLGIKAERLGLLVKGGSAFLVDQAVSHEISAGDFPGLGHWNLVCGARSNGV